MYQVLIQLGWSEAQQDNNSVVSELCMYFEQILEGTGRPSLTHPAILAVKRLTLVQNQKPVIVNYSYVRAKSKT